jgi:hypothetical protein
MELTAKIQKERDSVKKKSKIVAAKRVHVFRENAFFDLVKEPRPGLVTLSFDCQKNLPLPELPDQIVYYSRQLYLYNLALLRVLPQKKHHLVVSIQLFLGRRWVCQRV